MSVPVINDSIPVMVLLPMMAGILGVVARRTRWVQRLGVGALLGLCALCGVWLLATMPENGHWVSFVGMWPAPFGIVLVFDALSGVLMTIACLVGVACLVGSADERGDAYQTSWMGSLIGLLLMGVNFSFITGDLFNLFVAFEIMLMASYGLALRNASPMGIKQAHKYVVVNLVGSGVFVLSAGMVYGVAGTLNMNDLALYAAQGDPPVAFGAAGLMLLFVFTLKAAIFPMWFWLPDTYHTMPGVVGGLFAALLSKVGLYGVLRVIPPIFGGDLPGLELPTVLGVLAGLTMVIGALCALGVPTIRRVMSFVLIAHLGYALFMVSLGTPGSYGAASFLLAQEMFVIAGLYLVGSACVRAAGTDDLRRIASLHKELPFLSWLAFALTVAGAGLPPAAAFVAKAWIVQEGVRAGAWWLTGLMLVSAMLMLIALFRAWCAAFWHLREQQAEGYQAIEPSRWMTRAIGLLVLGVIVVSIGADTLHGFMARAGAIVAETPVDLRGVYSPPPMRQKAHDDEHGGGDHG